MTEQIEKGITSVFRQFCAKQLAEFSERTPPGKGFDDMLKRLDYYEASLKVLSEILIDNANQILSQGSCLEEDRKELRRQLAETIKSTMRNFAVNSFPKNEDTLKDALSRTTSGGKFEDR